MTVDDLNLVGVAVPPAKADAPLLVHANTVQAGSIATELLQSLSRRNAEVTELLGRVHRHKYAQYRASEIRWISSDGFASEQSLGITIGEALNHPE